MVGYKILFYCENQRKSEYHKVIWENRFNCDVECFQNKVQFLREIKKSSNLIIIVPREVLSFDEYLRELLECGEGNKIVLEGGDNSTFTKNKNLFSVSSLMNDKEFGLVASLMNLPSNITKDFARINIYQFLQFNEAKTDIYICIGVDKFLKIISEGELYSREIIEKYLDKKIKYLFVTNKDAKVYIDDLFVNIKNLSSARISSTNLGKEICLSVLDVLHFHFTEIGITENVLHDAVESIGNTFQTLSENVSIDEFSEMFNSSDFFVEHSIGSALIAYAILNNMEWKNKNNFEDIVVASLLHDISLKNKELSLINTQEIISSKEFEESQLRDLKEHPLRATVELGKFNFISENTMKIIKEHHEMPDGSGFPFGLNSQSISPLSSIFIISEHFYHALKESNFSKNGTNDAIRKISETFKDGNFKAPLKALINIFIQGE